MGFLPYSLRNYRSPIILLHDFLVLGDFGGGMVMVMGMGMGGMDGWHGEG